MTATASIVIPDIDWDTLIDHEFDVPCEVTTTLFEALTIPCKAAAEWFVEHEKHCPAGVVIGRLFCATHYAYMIGGGPFRCSECGDLSPIRVHRTERLKP